MKKLLSFLKDRSLVLFLAIGAVNTVLSNALGFVLNIYAGWGLFAATAAAYGICSVASFYFNRKYSFQSTAPLGQSILRFTVLVTACFLLSYGLNNVVVPQLRSALFPRMGHVPYALLRLLGIQVLFTALNYVGQRLWAFRAAPK